MAQPKDEEYKEATKTVVDDAMRTDILGPNLVRVLEDHKPASDLLHDIIAKSVCNDPDVKDALTKFIKDHDTNRKGKWIDRAIFVGVGAIITGVITYLVTFAMQNLPK